MKDFSQTINPLAVSPVRASGLARLNHALIQHDRCLASLSDKVNAEQRDYIAGWSRLVYRTAQRLNDTTAQNSAAVLLAENIGRLAMLDLDTATNARWLDLTPERSGGFGGHGRDNRTKGNDEDRIRDAAAVDRNRDRSDRGGAQRFGYCEPSDTDDFAEPTEADLAAIERGE